MDGKKTKRSSAASSVATTANQQLQVPRLLQQVTQRGYSFWKQQWKMSSQLSDGGGQRFPQIELQGEQNELWLFVVANGAYILTLLLHRWLLPLSCVLSILCLLLGLVCRTFVLRDNRRRIDSCRQLQQQSVLVAGGGAAAVGRAWEDVGRKEKEENLNTEEQEGKNPIAEGLEKAATEMVGEVKETRNVYDATYEGGRGRVDSLVIEAIEKGKNLTSVTVTDGNSATEPATILVTKDNEHETGQQHSRNRGATTVGRGKCRNNAVRDSGRKRQQELMMTTTLIHPGAEIAADNFYESINSWAISFRSLLLWHSPTFSAQVTAILLLIGRLSYNLPVYIVGFPLLWLMFAVYCCRRRCASSASTLSSPYLNSSCLLQIPYVNLVLSFCRRILSVIPKM